MSRFEVDTGVLVSAAGRLAITRDALAGYETYRRRVEVGASESGSHRAAKTIDGFLGEWGFGFEQIANDSQCLIESLTAAAGLYDETETAVADAASTAASAAGD